MTAHLEIWTDGSGTLTTGPACIGVALFEDGRLVEECSEYIGEGTNNVAELRAIRRGLFLAMTRWGLAAEVTVFSDSEYSIGAVTRQHEPRENAPLILAVRKQLQQRTGRWRFVHVHGHAGIYGNELADWLAWEARCRHFETLGVAKKRRRRPEADPAALAIAKSANVRKVSPARAARKAAA